MKKIMFVCYGNICRSPMAEFVFKDMVKNRGVESEFYISSSATSTEEIGNLVYPPSKEELKKHGISCEGKRAVQLRLDDYDKYDLFVCMDKNNVIDAKRMLGGDRDDKVVKLLDYANGGDVADPWYTRRFDIAYSDIERGCKALLDTLLAKNR